MKKLLDRLESMVTLKLIEEHDTKEIYGGSISYDCSQNNDCSTAYDYSNTNDSSDSNDIGCI